VTTQPAATSAVRIPVGDSYDVLVGSGVLGGVSTLVADAHTVAVVHSPAVAAVADRVVAMLGRGRLLTVPDGEAAKDLAAAAELWRGFADIGLTRTDAVVAVGGGTVSDVAGFAAGTWLRGLRFVAVPTTLLGMVDAAVGGKTAVNTAAGKNLVGVFHAPAGVVCDLDVLATLPAAEYRSGLAEVVKTGFIADPTLLSLLEAEPTGRAHAREVVERCVRVKAQVVSDDFREGGRREMLNYGHTLGHAIERVEDYRWRHGDAVSVGLVYAAALGRVAGRLDDATADRHRALLAAVGLPVSYPRSAWPQLSAAMRHDKKARGDRLRFVVLEGLARPTILTDPADDLLAAAYDEVAA
jgi:3-dehydroquinate synthase